MAEPKVTVNTLNDVSFAETYVKYIADRSLDPSSRARAKMLVGMMEYLDLSHPSWREDLLAHFAKAGVSRESAEMFALPEVDAARLYSQFMESVLAAAPPVLPLPAQRKVTK